MRRRISDRGLQLREKQKVRFTYGVLEAQFRRSSLKLSVSPA
jgi:small subunit ribosomal protein S4